MHIYASGTRIGPYEIASPPHMGGMGVVYFCIDHSNNNRPVALKTFRPEYLPNRTARDRFLREGATWVNLGSHPHIVRCYKVEYIDPTAFLVLELVAKEPDMQDASLRSWMGTPMPVEQALHFALQVARAMRYATEQLPGLVHRDLKPENLLIGADTLPGSGVNRLRITDFGLAKAVEETSKSQVTDNIPGKGSDQTLKRTQLTHGIVGTPLYMAPEQWKDEPVGIYTDVYALGCILYEMLNGQHAAEGKTINQVQQSHLNGMLRPLPTGLPTAVSSLLKRCLAIAPKERYGGWQALEAALEEIYAAQTGKPAPRSGDPEQADRTGRIQAGWSYSALGSSYRHMGQAQAAIGHIERAKEIAEQEGEKPLYCAALSQLGSAYLVLGNPRLAISFYNQSMEILREVGNRRGEGTLLGNLGEAYRLLGDAHQAIEFFEQALTIAREISDQHGESNALGNLGVAHAVLGNPHRAIGFYEQCLEIHRKLRDRRGEGATLGSLGEAYRLLGMPKKATRHYKQQLEIAREIGDRQSEGIALNNLGIAYSDLGNPQEAAINYEQALEIAREIGDRRSEGNALGNLGTAYTGLGDHRRAIGFYEQQITITREIGDRSGEGNALGNVGNAHVLLGNLQQAIEYYQQSLEIHREIGDRSSEGNDLNCLGITYASLGNTPRAIELCEQSLAIARETGNRHGEGNTLGNLGIVYSDRGDHHRAIGYYEQALAIRRDIGDINGVAIDSYNLAVHYMQQGKTARALPLAQEAAQAFAQVGHAEHTRQAQALIARLQGNAPPPVELSALETAFDGFQRAASPQEMQATVTQYPFMIKPGFIQAIEQVMSEQVRPEHLPAFEQRLAWLRQIIEIGKTPS